MKLHFLNYNHNGDIHYSRMFMQDLYNIISPEKCYLHMNCNPAIIKDLKYIETLPPVSFLDHATIEDDIYIVTWVGYFFKYIETSAYGASLSSNYMGFKNIYSQLGIESDLKEMDYYIPEVDYSYVEKNKIDDFFSHAVNIKNVFISNGNCLSGQSENFDFTPVIDELSNEFKNVNFILSHQTRLYKPNIFYTSNIININGNDLLEISYLSTKCDVIVGRASGPVCFSHTKQNLYNKNKTFISVANNEYEGNWHHLINDGAKQVWSNNYNINNITALIKNNI